MSAIAHHKKKKQKTLDIGILTSISKLLGFDICTIRTIWL